MVQVQNHSQNTDLYRSLRKLRWSYRLNPDTQQLGSLLNLRKEKQIIDYC